MPDTTNEFSLFLGASTDSPSGGSAPSASTVANVLSHTADAVQRLGQIADPETELVLTVRGFRRGSLLIALAIELLDNLGRASSTTHFFVCGTLFSAFGLMAKALYQSALVPPGGALPGGSKSETELAHRALQDNRFKFAIGAAFESALVDQNSQIVGIARPGSDKPEVQLPAGYFYDTRTGLALPRDAFENEERIYRRDVPILVSPASGDDPRQRFVYWTEGRQLVGAPATILNAKLLRRADNSAGAPIAVADLEIDIVSNSATRLLTYRAVFVRKARILPRET